LYFILLSLLIKQIFVAASWGDHLEIVAMLLCAGADINFKNVHGHKPSQECTLRVAHLFQNLSKYGKSVLDAHLPTTITNIPIQTTTLTYSGTKAKKKQGFFQFLGGKKDETPPEAPVLPTPISYVNHMLNMDQTAKIDVATWFECITGVKEPDFRNLPNKPYVDQGNGYLAIQNAVTGTLTRAGCFSIPVIGKMKKQLASGKSDRPVPFVIISRDASDTDAVRFVDVAFLQSLAINQNAVFQVASNFNAVEAGREKMSPDNHSFCNTYRWDRTQGPTAAISAGAAAIVRVHAAFYNPETEQATWPQTKKNQINLLEGLEEHFPIKNGYVIWKDLEYPKFPKRGTKQYESLLNKARVGYHKDVQVTSGHRTPSFVEVVKHDQTIDQVFCAAVNIGQGDSGGDNIKATDAIEKCRFALDVSYEGAYLTAITNNKAHLILTLIGGGAFNNNREDIYNAILDAHLKFTGNIKCKLEKVSLVVFRGEEVWDDFMVKLQENGVPYIYEWYKADGNAEVMSRFPSV